MVVGVMLMQDRHTDLEVTVYADPAAAVAHAEAETASWEDRPTDVEDHGPHYGQPPDDLYWARLSEEGDYVRVVVCTLA